MQDSEASQARPPRASWVRSDCQGTPPNQRTLNVALSQSAARTGRGPSQAQADVQQLGFPDAGGQLGRSAIQSQCLGSSIEPDARPRPYALSGLAASRQPAYLRPKDLALQPQ